MLTPARAGRVEAGRVSAVTPVQTGLGLDTTEHDGRLVRSGPDDLSLFHHGTLDVVGMTIRGEPAFGREHSRRNLVSGGPRRPEPWCTRAHRQRSSEAADPFCTTAWLPWFTRDPATSNRHRRPLTVEWIEPKLLGDQW